MKKVLSIVLASIMVFSMVGCGSNQSAGSTQSANQTNDSVDNSNSQDNEDQVYNLKFACTLSQFELENNSAGVAVAHFIEKVENDSNGQIKIQLFKDGTLGKSTDEILGGAKNGAFDFYNFPIGNYGEYSDAFMPLNIPYLFLSAETMYKVLDDGLGDRMKDKVVDDTGLRTLSYLDIGFRQLTNSSKMIATPSDMAGLKFRTMPDKYQVALFEKLGATSMTTSYAELYSALQQKLCDGQDNPIVNVYTGKIFETQKYMTLSKHAYTFTSIGCNESVFESLPEDLQLIVLEAASEAELVSREKVAETEADMLNELSKSLEIYEPTEEELQKFQEKAKSVWPMLQEAMGDEYWNYVMDLVEKHSS